VFQSQRQRAAFGTYPLPFSGEERRPAGVVLDEADDTRLKAEAVSDRCRLTDRAEAAAQRQNVHK